MGDRKLLGYRRSDVAGVAWRPAAQLLPATPGLAQPQRAEGCDITQRRVQPPTAPPATETSLWAERQLTVGRMASKFTRALYFSAVSMRLPIVSSVSR